MNEVNEVVSFLPNRKLIDEICTLYLTRQVVIVIDGGHKILEFVMMPSKGGSCYFDKLLSHRYRALSFDNCNG